VVKMRTVRWTFVQGYLIFESNRQIVDKERKWERERVKCNK
jgi:hypothetical protein